MTSRRRQPPSGMESTVAADEAKDRPSPRFRPISVGSSLGRYELVGELGEGGMATVYRARDSELRREVAVKVLFPHLCKRREVVARFQREARAVAALDHPNILRIHDVGGGAGDVDETEEVDPPYIVLELVRGRSLREHMVEHGAMLGEVVACIGAVICSALRVAHREGIIHRDIKPANIMVADGGRVVLADFGVARVQDEESSLVTRTGAILGTPAFMSPEQAQGEALDARSDVYSLGATLYQLATGSMPFGGPTPKLMWAIAHGELTPPLRRNPAIGAELAGVIETMMAPDPDARYADAAAAEKALREIARAGEIDDEAAELADFFADPAAHAERRTPAIARITIERARAAADDGSLPKALALADRALALAPDDPDALALVDRLGRRRSRGRWLAVAGALIVAAGAGAAAVSVLGSGDDDRPVSALSDAGPPDAAGIALSDLPGATDAAVRPTGLTGDQPGTRWPDAGQKRVAVRPERTPTRPPSRPPDRPSAPPDAAVPVVRAPPDAAPVVREPPKPASVTLDLRPWCNVTIDGTSHGRASRAKPIQLAPGKHTIVCSQGPGMAEWRRTVTLAPGEARTFRGSLLREVAVTLELSGGDGIRIGDRFIRDGSRVNLAPDRYRIEVVSGGKTVTARWVTIPRGTACTLRDRPALGCYAPKP